MQREADSTTTERKISSLGLKIGFIQISHTNSFINFYQAQAKYIKMQDVVVLLTPRQTLSLPRSPTDLIGLYLRLY